MIRLIDWECLPCYMQTETVREYYNILSNKRKSLMAKRIFDVLASVALLILLSPVLVVIAVWIKLDSSGSVLFRQERVTRYGKIFRICKFRTMVKNADQIGCAVTTNNDMRITKAGARIRSMRLDELPQLWNVLLGDMSFVGTRPEIPKYVECYSDEMYATLLLPAGITSEASIRYKDESKLLETAEDADRVYVEQILPEKMRYNLESIRKFGFFREALTMIRTLGAVLK